MYIHVAVLSNADVDLIITDVDLINAVAVLTLQGTFLPFWTAQTNILCRTLFLLADIGTI